MPTNIVNFITSKKIAFLKFKTQFQPKNKKMIIPGKSRDPGVKNFGKSRFPGNEKTGNLGTLRERERERRISV